MKERILIALSDANLVDLISAQLNSAGYIVDYTTDGADVITKMKSFSPDLLLLDVTLANKNGYDVLSEKSFDRFVTKIPIIIVSNSGQPIHMSKIPSTPTIKGFIIKSHVEPREVLEKIDIYFGRGPLVNSIVNDLPKEDTGKKILWAEDDKLLSKILTKKILAAGYTLLKANNSTEVFEILKKDLPDIIILDILLPGTSGLDILREIKKFEHLRKIPVIMLSNLDAQTDIEKAQTLGANKYMVKATVSLDEIIKAAAGLIDITR
jgi:DNA-binding response OmpR family regulator